MGLTFTTDESGPLFDGTAEVLMHEATEAIKHRLAREGERLTRTAFAAQIRENHGVFLSTITAIEHTHVFDTASSWNRDTDRPGGGEQHITRVYTMPVTVTDPTVEDVVTTELATYGPWLEGTGSRNETTRFKGYHGFRMAGQALNAMAEGIAEAEIAPYVEAVNR